MIVAHRRDLVHVAGRVQAAKTRIGDRTARQEGTLYPTCAFRRMVSSSSGARAWSRWVCCLSS